MRRGPLIGSRGSVAAPVRRAIVQRATARKRLPASALYNPLQIAPHELVLVSDSRYTPTSTQAMFLQQANVPMVFIVPVSPTPGATGVSPSEDVQAHAIANYTATATVKIKVNGTEVPVTITPTSGGVFISMVPGAQDLIDSGDGKTHLRAEGTEDVAGAQFAEWQITPRTRPLVVEIAAGQISIAPALLALAAAQIAIPGALAALADAQVLINSSLSVIGEAAGRMFVGDLYLRTNAGGSLNIALDAGSKAAAGSVEIHGFAIFDPASGSLEIQGIRIVTGTGGSGEVAGVTLARDASGSGHVGTADDFKPVSGSVELWGTYSKIPEGKLIIQVSALHPTLVAALASAGLQFNFESPIATGIGTVGADGA